MPRDQRWFISHPPTGGFGSRVIQITGYIGQITIYYPQERLRQAWRSTPGYVSSCGPSLRL